MWLATETTSGCRNVAAKRTDTVCCRRSAAVVTGIPYYPPAPAGYKPASAQLTAQLDANLVAVRLAACRSQTRP